MEYVRKNFALMALAILLVTNIFIWYAVFEEDNRGILTVAFLDVGQGDSVFIEAPNGNQLLIDGGPNNSVLRELGEVMPFYDRSIDVVVATHPDKDHISGLPAVLEKFKVGVFIESQVQSKSGVYEALNRVAEKKDIKKIIPQRGERIFLGDGVYLDVLSPDRATDGWETNTASVVMKLVYKNTSFILSGDAPKKMEEYITLLGGKNLSANVLKLGHHGSRTSTSEVFLSAVNPEVAIVSAGLNNRYGHPHKEVTDMLKKFNIPILATYERGTIIIQSDGENIKVQP